MTQQQIVRASRLEAVAAYDRYLESVEEGARETKRKLERSSWQYVEDRFRDELAIYAAQQRAETQRAPRE